VIEVCQEIHSRVAIYILFGYLFHLEASDRKLLFVKYFYRINNYINLLGDQNPTEISRLEPFIYKVRSIKNVAKLSCPDGLTRYKSWE
jgi:hypothetical protein